MQADVKDVIIGQLYQQVVMATAEIQRLTEENKSLKEVKDEKKD